MNIRPKRAARVTHDAYGLGPLGASFLLIGSVDEVNGQGAVEVPEFVPTRFELKIVAEHWNREYLQTSFWCFCVQGSGSREIRIRPFAVPRLNRIESVLGEGALNHVTEDVESEP